MAWTRDELALKDAFAAAWLRNGDDIFKAALEVFGFAQAGKALEYADKWALDPYILEKKKSLLADDGEDAYLPTKGQIARKILDAHDKAPMTDDKIKALRLYSELMGFITKDGVNGKLVAPVTLTISPTDAKL